MVLSAMFSVCSHETAGIHMRAVFDRLLLRIGHTSQPALFKAR
jgi:hypothetical protein